jgi:glycosyltransferase involved in cell wall biosynthesis
MAELVSVIIPTYNRAHCLARAVDSALNQSHAEVEVVVVDDGSSDGTGDLVRSRYDGNPRVRYLWQANAGVAGARNTALAAAAGDYVAFLDSDDWWQPWKLQLQLTVLRAFPEAGMVWSEMEARDPAGGLVQARYLRTYYGAYRWFSSPADLFTERRFIAGPDGEVAAYAGDIYSAMIMGNLVHTSTALLRRERLERVGGFDLALAPVGEDYDFHLRTCRAGPVTFADVASIHYQVGTTDRLTGHRRTMATNYLGTISRAVEQDAQRITLPPRMLHMAFADAHRWIAEVLVEEGCRVEGRRHYGQSLRHYPWQPRAIAQMALCTLPSGTASLLRHAWHRLHRV